MQRRLAGARRCLTLVCKSAPLPSVSVTRKAIFLPLICPTCQTAATRAARSKDYRKSIRSGPSSGKYVSPKSTLRDSRQTAPTIMPRR